MLLVYLGFKALRCVLPVLRMHCFIIVVELFSRYYDCIDRIALFVFSSCPSFVTMFRNK